MGCGKKPGPDCLHRHKRKIKDGTLHPHKSPKPGVLGTSTAQAKTEATEDHARPGDWSSAVKDWFNRAGEKASSNSKSFLLTLMDMVPFKESSPFATAFLKHYVERSGEPYTISSVPVPWQDWIVKATHARPGMHKDMDPYNSGLFDLRNALGHFDVEVKANEHGTRTYFISDVYEFGFKKHDKKQQGRHGFPLGNMSSWQLAALRKMLPSTEYKNPGGFKEHFEIRSIGKETILFIPQQYLAEQGKPFKVTGTFTR